MTIAMSKLESTAGRVDGILRPADTLRTPLIDSKDFDVSISFFWATTSPGFFSQQTTTCVTGRAGTMYTGQQPPKKINVTRIAGCRFIFDDFPGRFSHSAATPATSRASS